MSLALKKLSLGGREMSKQLITTPHHTQAPLFTRLSLLFPIGPQQRLDLCSSMKPSTLKLANSQWQKNSITKTCDFNRERHSSVFSVNCKLFKIHVLQTSGGY